MDKNEYIDWLDWHYTELVKEFIAIKGELFHEYCEEEYNNAKIGNN